MKKLFSIFLFFVFSTCSIYAMMGDDSSEFYYKIEQSFNNHRSLFNSSKDQNIVVFLGLTGSGKSTLLNFLNGIPLKVNQDDEIELDTSHGTFDEYFEIGDKKSSTTLIPKHVYNPSLNSVMYDFSGFGDNRGSIENLLGAAFIKNIIEQSKSCKIVFVMEEASMIAKRGELFDEMISISSNLFGQQDTIDSSAIVISKARHKKPVDELKFIKKKLLKPGEDLTVDFWGVAKLENIFLFTEGLIEEFQREEILNGIKHLSAKKLAAVNINSMYDHKMLVKLGGLFDKENNRVFRNEVSKANYLTQIKNAEELSDIDKIKKSINGFSDRVTLEITKSKLLILLKPLAQESYEKSYKKINELLDIEVIKITTLLKEKQSEIKEKKLLLEKKQAEDRAKKEELLRKKAEENELKEKIRRQQMEESKESKLIERHYYPSFSSGFSTPSTYQSTYVNTSQSSHLQQTKTSKNTNSKSNWQDSGGRWHDGDTGRFIKAPTSSSYSGVNNTPSFSSSSFSSKPNWQDSGGRWHDGATGRFTKGP